MYLLNGNIEDDKITFYREKTRNTSKQNMKPIVAMLVPETMEIIKKRGNDPKPDDDYGFPIRQVFIQISHQLAHEQGGLDIGGFDCKCFHTLLRTGGVFTGWSRNPS